MIIHDNDYYITSMYIVYKIGFYDTNLKNSYKASKNIRKNPRANKKSPGMRILLWSIINHHIDF